MLRKPGRTTFPRLGAVAFQPRAASLLSGVPAARCGQGRRVVRRGQPACLESDVLQPGDSVVMPSLVDFETWGRALVRNLKDFSQIFRTFGISAIALNQLKQ